jgi:formylglycine-generating enzyme required for sulfatase activity
MVWITGGTFLMGSDKHYPEEAPAHDVTVDGFWMDRHTVTNEEFRKFVEATKHVTSAERAPKAEDYPGVPTRHGSRHETVNRRRWHTPRRWYRQSALSPFHGLVQSIPIRDVDQCASTVERGQGRNI